MQSKSKFLAGSAIVVIIAVGIILGKSKLFTGDIGSSVFNYGATVLVDSARGDTDFDGVPVGRDRCLDLPPYQIVMFQKNNSVQYLGHRVSLNDIGTNSGGGSNLNFDVDGTIYSAEVNREAYIPPISPNQGFLIKNLFASRGQNLGIVVLRRADVNLDNGCLAGS